MVNHAFSLMTAETEPTVVGVTVQDKRSLRCLAERMRKLSTAFLSFKSAAGKAFFCDFCKGAKPQVTVEASQFGPYQRNVE